MVRFSCFNSHIHSQKPKKPFQTSVESMRKNLQDSSRIKALTAPSKTTSLNSSLLKVQADTENTGSIKSVTSSVFVEQGWKAEEIKGKQIIGNDTRFHQKGLIKKSQSLGSGLCHEGRTLCENDIEDDTDQGLSSDSLDQNGIGGPYCTKDAGVSTTSDRENVPQSQTAQFGSDIVNDKSILSIEDPRHSEKEGPENSEVLVSSEGGNESRNPMPSTPPMIVQSSSLPDIRSSSLSSGQAPRARSCEDLHMLHMRWKEVSFCEVEMQVMQEQERNYNDSKTEKNNFEISLDDGYDPYNYSASAKDWIIPVADEVNMATILHRKSSSGLYDELPNKDFKMKRIEEWIIDLQHCSPLEGSNELTDTNRPLNRDSTVISGLRGTRVDTNVTPGMEAAKKYISCLSANATTAQLSNHGLAVIPYLSAFVSLRVLNLSGNSIVRISAGALPRGLHMLNLSKNNISTIEGLRELTRLRVLDLSYNRIFRIGHGLASCSSLKELYLAGNKISEVEGLHRLLKLTVLDLRFNKISTAKCLGQLAANYNSLQAISLEGNPAQKNVGDEQLKKHLQGLLPHLLYFNRQPIKVSTLKDAADRVVRLGINAHQFERGQRSDNKGTRKGGHGQAGTRLTSSTIHGRKNQAVGSPKRSRGRNARLPPTGTKATTDHRHHYFDISGKHLNYRSERSIRRSRSEGTLRAL